MKGIRYTDNNGIEQLGLVHSSFKKYPTKPKTRNRIGIIFIYSVFHLERCDEHDDPTGIQALMVDYTTTILVNPTRVVEQIHLFHWSQVEKQAQIIRSDRQSLRNKDKEYFYLHSQRTESGVEQLFSDFKTKLTSPKLAFECCLSRYGIPIDLRAIMTNQYRMSIPLKNHTLCYAVKLWEYDYLECYTKYGLISAWDTSDVTNMSKLFQPYSDFNDDISMWDVSNVTNMNNMFNNVYKFNYSLNSWNISNVVNIANIFHGASAYNQPMDNWNVNNVTDMSGAFHMASSFNQPLNNWQTSKVTCMKEMFRHAQAFNQPLDFWDIRNVQNSASMFYGATKFNQPSTIRKIPQTE